VIERIAFWVNGVRVEVETDPMRRLAAVLHDDLDLTDMKTGCNAGDCGGCTVRVNGRQVSACLVAVAQVEGCEIVTLEGFAGTGGR
jgi:aerobic-type carbon monoxide dehydrogenase small subunit (CoxS/CutS family)